jgi:hypothetical protein
MTSPGQSTPSLIWSKPVSVSLRTHRRRIALALVSASSLSLFLAGCGSSGSAAATDNSTPSSDATSATSSSGGGGDDAKAAAVDVCSLLTPADAQAIGTATKLSSLPNVTYKLMSEDPMKTPSSSSCTLTIYNELPDGTSGNEAIVTVQVEPAKYRDTIGDKKISGGPGDVSYMDGEEEQVITGDYLLQSGQHQGASQQLIDAMYTAMIPRLKAALGS